MRINRNKLDLELARNCKPLSELRGKGLSPQTLARVSRGENLKPITVGKIAKALGVDPVEIIDMED